MNRFPRFVIALVLLAAGLTLVAASGGSPTPKIEAPAVPEQSPEEQAKDHYNWGLKARDKAWKLEQRAEGAAGEAEREKLLGKARKQYRKAIQEFTKAVQINPRFHAAFSSLGYASRKVGDYEFAIRAYDAALELDPDYAEAIEYRAEAFLGLERVEDAKEAYMRLFNLDREKADELLAAMKRWVDERREAPGGLGAEAVEELSRWVEQREEIARQTASVPQRRDGGW